MPMSFVSQNKLYHERVITQHSLMQESISTGVCRSGIGALLKKKKGNWGIASSVPPSAKVYFPFDL